ITDATGNQVWTWDHLAFGDNAPNQNPSSLGVFNYNARFPGQYADAESGLNYNMARDYNPTTGRYVQSDPLGLVAGVNTYGYVNGNPLGYTDPTGRDAIPIPQLIRPFVRPVAAFCELNPAACLIGLGILTGYVVYEELHNCPQTAQMQNTMMNND